MRGGAEGAKQFNALLARSDLQWSFRRSQLADAEVSENLQDKMSGIDFAAYPATGIYRELSKAERDRVRGAMGRLKDGSAQAAVPHEINGEKIIHHLHLSDDRVYGRIEPLDEGADVDDWTKRDLLSGAAKRICSENVDQDAARRKKETGRIDAWPQEFSHDQRCIWSFGW